MKKSIFTKVNYVVSILFMVILLYFGCVLAYVLGIGFFSFAREYDYLNIFVFAGDFFIALGIIALFMVIGIIFTLSLGVQLFFLISGINRKKKHLDVNYGKTIEFSKVMLVLHAVYIVGIRLLLVFVSPFS